MAKRQKRALERVSAVFSRLLNGKPDEDRIVLELERDDELGNMNIPGALMNAHIVVGSVPDGAFTLTYNGKSEQVTILANRIIWNQEELRMGATVRVLATDCPNCRAENIANLASEHQTGLRINPPDQTTCAKCSHVYATEYLYLREKTEAEMNAIGGVGVFSYRL